MVLVLLVHGWMSKIKVEEEIEGLTEEQYSLAVDLRHTLFCRSYHKFLS